MNLQSHQACGPAIRPRSANDWTSLLRLNAENHPAVAPLDETGLAHLMGFDGYHLAAVDEQGREMT